jgi:glycerol-3-phosphate acyltransferase PlsY
MTTAAFLVLAFLIGYLVDPVRDMHKLARHAGLRSIGSGNIGATNVLRTGRKGLAAATLIGDALKGTVAVIIAGYYGGANAAMLAALGAFLGHLFPVWLKFNGGKGVATYIGVWSACSGGGDVLPDLVSRRLTTRYSSLSALVAAFVRRCSCGGSAPGAGVAVRRAGCCCSGSTAKISNGCRLGRKGRVGA